MDIMEERDRRSMRKIEEQKEKGINMDKLHFEKRQIKKRQERKHNLE